MLAIALFGGSMLIPHFYDESALRCSPRRCHPGCLTGILLFASGAAGYYKSTSFRIKMVLLALIVVNAIGLSSAPRQTAVGDFTGVMGCGDFRRPRYRVLLKFLR